MRSFVFNSVLNQLRFKLSSRWERGSVTRSNFPCNKILEALTRLRYRRAAAHRAALRLRLLRFPVLANLRQQLVALRGVAGAATSRRFLRFGKNGLRAIHGCARGINRRLRFREMALADGHAVEGAFRQFGSRRIRLRLGAEVVFEIFP